MKRLILIIFLIVISLNMSGCSNSAAFLGALGGGIAGGPIGILPGAIAGDAIGKVVSGKPLFEVKEKPEKEVEPEVRNEERELEELEEIF